MFPAVARSGARFGAATLLRRRPLATTASLVPSLSSTMDFAPVRAGPSRAILSKSNSGSNSSPAWGDDFRGPTLTASQQRAMTTLLTTNKNVFLTGKAGTGKSYLIDMFRDVIAGMPVNRDTGEKKTRLAILASTGFAAVRLEGSTFHSFFGLGLRDAERDRVIPPRPPSSKVRERIMAADCIVIDEISMIPGYLLAVAEELARTVRKSKLPWGGMRVVAVGDFFQLPPVTKRGYARDWAFAHPIWERSGFEFIELKEVTRQKDLDFLSALNDVRVGTVSPESDEYFRSREVNDLPSHIEVTRAFPLRAATNRFNKLKLDALPGKLISVPTTYRASETYTHVPNIEKQLMELGSSVVPKQIDLKIGAFVMITRNNHNLNLYANGTQGTVVDVADDALVIERAAEDNAESEYIRLERVSEDIRDPSGDVIGTASTFPISLAWASTIHKLQGSTLRRYHVDLTNAWEVGQMYVALSRGTTPKGLYITNWQKRLVSIDPQVARFYEYCDFLAERERASRVAVSPI